MADTEQIRSKSCEALLRALERGSIREGVSSESGSNVVYSSISVLANRIEAAIFELYGRDLSLEHARPGASADEETSAERLVTRHGDLVATKAYREAIRSHVLTLTSNNPGLAVLLVDGDLSPDTFAAMSPQDMMSSSMQRNAEKTKQEFLNAERGYLPEKGDFITPAQAGWDLEGAGNMDADPDVDNVH